MSPQERHSLIQEAMHAFNPHYREAIGEIFSENKMQGSDWYLSYVAFGMEPKLLTANFLHKTAPYGKASLQEDRLAQTAGRGFLAAVGNGYQLTETGRAAVSDFFEKATRAIGGLEPLPAADMARLVDMLGRIVAATEKAGPPAGRLQFTLSRTTHPGAEAPAPVFVDQYLTDLLRYRDDAHIAAWQDLGVSGPAWETFTAVWREEANTAAALAERFSQRGYNDDDYANFLEELAGKGWIEAADGAYRVTGNGRALREEAEAATDRIYFTGWSALTAAEADELDGLLTQLRDNLRDLAGDLAAAARADLWPVANSISTSLFQLTRDAVNPAIEQANLAEPGLAFTLIQAASFDPEPVSGRHITKRFPYANPVSWDRRLAKLADRGYVTLAANGGTKMTDDGRRAFNTFLGAFRGKLNHLAEAVEVDLDRLADLLGQVVNSCLNAPTPPGSWAVANSHRLFPDGDAAPLAQIDQYLDDLNAFRDDAHTAAWSGLDTTGPAWELFTMLWKEQVKDAAGMAEKAAFRGHDEAVYAKGMADLTAKGWVAAAGDGFALTAAGTAVRQAAETQTDRYFYLPWTAVNAAGTQELRDLLTGLDAQLKKQVEAIPA